MDYGAAGLAISSSLNADAAVYAQGIRNLNDGISLIDIAEGALNELSNITTRIRELASQAANGVYTTKQRAAFDKEADQLVDEYNRILNTTSFNNLALLNGSTSQISLQGGYGQSAALNFSLLPQNSTGYAGSGTFGATQSYSGVSASSRDIERADLNGDGFADMVVSTDFGNSVNVLLGNGDGSFKAVSAYAAGARVYQSTLADFNGDGFVDIATSNHSGASTSILLNNGNGTFKAATNISIAAPFGISSGDVNGDGIADIVASQYFNSAATVLLGNGNGTFQAAKSFAIGPNATDLKLGDLNNDNILDIVAKTSGGSTFTVLLGNGNGTFKSMTTVTSGGPGSFFALDDFNDDGLLDYTTTAGTSVITMLGNGDGTFKAAATLNSTAASGWSIETGDFNSDGFRDITFNILDAGPIGRQGIILGNGDGTFKAAVSTGAFGGQTSGFDPSDAVVVDINGDGVDDIVTVDPSGAIYREVTDAVRSLRLGRFNLNYKSGALAAIPILDRAKNNVMDLRGRLGAVSARTQAAIANLSTTRENFIDASSRINDADVAVETANVVRLKILQQAGAAILASAAKEPELALKLVSDSKLQR